MLTEEKVIGAITVLEDGPIQLREDTVIKRDGVEIHRTYHRTVIVPGENVAAQTARVRDIAGLVWTPEVVAAHEARQRRIREEFEARTRLRGVTPASDPENRA